jgi:hypothetical protein
MIGIIRTVLEILKAAFGYAKNVEKTKLEKEAVDRRTSKRKRLDAWMQDPDEAGQHQDTGGGKSEGL